jgi:ABC-type nitrate/sulfonate/bicarbonate transport system substrate-binding protein
VDATYGSPERAPSTSLNLGTFSPSVLLRVARRTGRLAQYGLEVTEHPVTSSPGQFEALLDGRYDAVLTSPDNVLAYRYVADNPLGRTVDARIVCAVDRGMGLALYGRPDLGSAEPLRGATLGVDVPTSGFALAMYAVLDEIGWGQDDDRVVALGATPMRLEALLNGECDATMLNAGNDLKAEGAGCVALGRVSDLGRPYLGTVLAVVGETRADVAKRLAAALLETARDIAASRHDALVVEEAIDALSLSTPLAGRYLLRLKSKDEGLVPDGRVDAPSLRTLVDLRRRYLPHNGAGPDPLDAALGPDSALLLDHARR